MTSAANMKYTLKARVREFGVPPIHDAWCSASSSAYRLRRDPQGDRVSGGEPVRPYRARGRRHQRHHRAQRDHAAHTERQTDRVRGFPDQTAHGRGRNPASRPGGRGGNGRESSVVMLTARHALCPFVARSRPISARHPPRRKRRSMPCSPRRRPAGGRRRFSRAGDAQPNRPVSRNASSPICCRARRRPGRGATPVDDLVAHLDRENIEAITVEERGAFLAR